MKNKQNIACLREATHLILTCGDQYGIMYEAVHQMHDLYCQFSTVNVKNQDDPEIILPSGKAISPASAAHCLLEMTRTTRFLRGINKAIEEKRKTVKKVRILYAGCGPYATLITPLLTQFSESELAVDLLDINKVSLTSAKQVIEGLKLESFIEDYLLEDAANYTLIKDYDIIISETLQSALQNEPFVAIYQNLVPQAKSACLFIPEEVTVELKLNSHGDWNANKGCNENQKYIALGDVLRINRNSVLSDLPKTKTEVNNSFEENAELKFHTTITVFRDEILSNGDGSLNIPLKIDELKQQQTKQYEFSYKQEYPAKIKIDSRNIQINFI